MTGPMGENEMGLIDKALIDESIPSVCCQSFVARLVATGVLVALPLGPGVVAKLLLPFRTAEVLAQTIDSALDRVEERCLNA